VNRNRNKEIEGGCHCADVGGRFKGVSDQHTDQGEIKKPSRIVIPDNCEQTLARHLSEF
jgi:hypothetical protein